MDANKKILPAKDAKGREKKKRNSSPIRVLSRIRGHFLGLLPLKLLLAHEPEEFGPRIARINANKKLLLAKDAKRTRKEETEFFSYSRPFALFAGTFLVYCR